MKKGKLLSFGSKSKKEEIVDKYPMMEYSAPRRLRATPMGEETAEKEGIKNAFPHPPQKEGVDITYREGFHVIEQTGIAIIEYWMPKTIFDPNHIRTKTYTIGEVMIMILQGQLFRRASWPMNKFIQYRESVDLDNDLKEFVPTKENPACAKMESFITMATIHADPIRKGKFDVHVEPWMVTQDDLFAKDFQSFRIDLNNVAGKKKKK